MSSPSDEQRQQVQDELTRAVGTGRINIKQFDYLLGIVWSCESADVLDSIRRDYLGQVGPGAGAGLHPGHRPGAAPSHGSAPGHGSAAGHSPAPSHGPARYHPGPARYGQYSSPVPLKTTLGTIELTGDWRVPERQEFVVNAGTLLIDLRQARADSLFVEFNITARMATIRIIAPEGVPVENRLANNLASTFDILQTTPNPQAPRVILTGAVTGSTVTVKRPGRRRTWRERLQL